MKNNESEIKENNTQAEDHLTKKNKKDEVVIMTSFMVMLIIIIIFFIGLIFANNKDPRKIANIQKLETYKINIESEQNLLLSGKYSIVNIISKQGVYRITSNDAKKWKLTTDDEMYLHSKKKLTGINHRWICPSEDWHYKECFKLSDHLNML